MAYDYSPYPYVPPPGLRAPELRHEVVIVGAGPIGLALALDLAGYGVGAVVLDDNNVVSVGSRAICWSKRSLEILDRLGVAERVLAKGETWKVGRTYHGTREVFHYDLLPEDGHRMPAFVNLQQYYVEEFLIEAALQNPLIDVRFKNRVTGVDRHSDHVFLDIETPDGEYSLETSWLIACDGAKSPVRGMLGLDFAGEQFEERFLIADIEMEADFPSERWFWFEPEFHSGQSALLHKQPDHIYRIDLQLGWDADPKEEARPERVVPRIEKVVGHSDFRLDWVSIYSFQCARLEQFVHGRVVFCGDSAHVVSPFGARGGNGGLQDVDALGWRLAAITGGATERLLQDYDRERQYGADENINNSARTTRFMTPDDGVERLFRDSVLTLAEKAPFAQSWVNSGRLSRPCVYPLSGADDDRLPDVSRPGSVAPDAPQGDGWLLGDLGGEVVVMTLGIEMADLRGAAVITPAMNPMLRARYLGDAPSAIYVIRPDQIVAERWVSAELDTVQAAIDAIWEPCEWD